MFTIDIEGFLVALGLLSLFIIFTIILLYQTIKHKKSGDFVTWAMISGIFGSILHLLGNIFNDFRAPGAWQNYFTIIAAVVFGFAFFCIHVFLERNRAENLQGIWNAFIILLFGIALGSVLFYLRDPIYENFLLPVTAWTILGIGIFFNGARIHWDIYRTTNREKIPLIQTIALIIIGLGFFVYLLESSQKTSYGNLLQMTGFFLYVITYIGNINYMYRLPIRIKFISVFNEAGIPLFQISWQPEIAEKAELIVGAFNAVNSLLSHTLSTKEPINLIKAPRGAVMLRQRENLTVIVIAESTNAILARSLDRFLYEFSQQISETSIVRVDQLEEIMEKSLPLLLQAFPYLELPPELSSGEG
ncbi:MAG: hypothetical protein ACFFDI_23085 [Promethearchaeota archaeon]